MPRITYQDKRFRPASLALIATCNNIIDDYMAQGFSLTLRQLYYQLVARGVIPNQQTEYNRLGSLINDARLAGLVDWEAIVDRTRALRSLAHWEQPSEIVDAAAQQYRVDLWAGQDYRPEVWIEKDALVGVIEGVCNELDVPYFSCRGYTSQSEMWGAGQRLLHHMRYEGTPVIFHFGDHDPSGLDMTRDIADRLAMFCGSTIGVRRLALTMGQVEEHKPPPNPAKVTDSRYKAYVVECGDDSWELDALPPDVLAELVRQAVGSVVDWEQFNKRARQAERGRKQLAKVAKQLGGGK